jgi:hypothetical protein
MIVALAGRRIDAPGADSPRFPLSNVELVRARLHKLFLEKPATALVCSAACGSDLLALTLAGELGIRRRLILPFTREHFRETSVVDRPGDWGSMFDAICNEVAEQGDLVILGCAEDAEADAYSATTSAIFDEAVRLGTGDKGRGDQSLLAIIVWEGAATGVDDETAAFAREARSRRVAVQEVLTN